LVKKTILSGRGNLTLVQKWLNSTGGLVTANQTSFYDTGVPYQSKDLKNNATSYSYDSAYYGAYVTQTQLPNTGASAAFTHIIKGTYDFNTGLLTSFTDQNNQTSNYVYDALWRTQNASFPDGGAVTFNYVDSVPVQISKTVKVTATVNKQSNTVFDGLGRVSQTPSATRPQYAILLTKKRAKVIVRPSPLHRKFFTSIRLDSANSF